MISFRSLVGLSALLITAAAVSLPARAEDGYELWLRYRAPTDSSRATEYRQYGEISVPGVNSGNRPILQGAKDELTRALKGINGSSGSGASRIILGTPEDSAFLRSALAPADEKRLGSEGFIVRQVQDGTKSALVVVGGGDAGVLYGTFRLIKTLQLGWPLAHLNLADSPRVKLRMVNQWDNPVIGEDTWSVERGYGGPSIFHWDQLPERVDPRLTDYARLLAAMGINGTSINNVNTAKHGLEGWRLLTSAWLPKVKAMAAVLRPYGVRLYLSVNFFSPVIIDKLPTADPKDPAVAAWWKAKADELYREIPDFGGFVIKADSENEPGPYKYGRDHADGANMIAAALAPHGGIAIWRAFVYTEKGDRVTDAYRNFIPLDGKFTDHAFLQVKNGPLDFQIREPVSPLLAAMPRTNQMLEVEISQEYTGQDRHVCFLAPEWREVLDFDTHKVGEGSTISRLITGSLFPPQQGGIAGVMNIGSNRNWTGHLLAQANTYAFGRLAWDPEATPAEIADDWVRLTFGQDPRVVAAVSRILLKSRAVFESYTAPLGLGLLTERGNHLNPALAYRKNYTHADATGVGYDRTVATGSGYAGQYNEPWKTRLSDPATCPTDLLLFFHHVPYTMVLPDGRTVLQELYYRHDHGVEQANEFVAEWKSLKGLIDDERYAAVLARLEDQVTLAAQWRDAFNGYFVKLSGIPDQNATPRG
jgi:alpha-glucuronidase